MSLDHVDRFREWMNTNEVRLSPNLDIKESQLGGTGVFAKRAFGEDDIVLSVPKSSILSAKTCGIADLLDEADIDGLHQPVLAYLFERAQGSSSPWADFIDYIESTPLPDVPRLWPAHEQERLTGCDIMMMGGLEQEQITDSYDEIKEFLTAHTELFGVIELDHYADCLIRISSRVFEIDNYHGLALVPGACLFNHSDTENLHFETDYMVCGMCGNLECGCIYDDAMEEGSDEEDAPAQDTRDEPGRDMPPPTNDESDSDSRADSPDLGKSTDDESEAGSTSDVLDDNICEMRVCRLVIEGQEIFNTYGEDSNSILLARYGFCTWENKHEMVDLSLEVLHLVKQLKKSKIYKAWKKRYDASADEEEEEEEDGPMLAVNILGQPSQALDSLLSCLGNSELLKELATARLSKFKIPESSSEIYRRVQDTQSLTDRDLNTLILVGTQKLALERAMY